MTTLLNQQTDITDASLRAIAHMPTRSLAILMDDDFVQNLTDADFMRIAVYLAQKSMGEGGCPIGAVIVNNTTHRIVGKGHNTLVQEDHPYNHGETSAIRDAGRINFGETTLYTSLSPCEVCATLLYMRGFSRVVVGDVTNANGTEAYMRQKKIIVDILEDPLGIKLYADFRADNPDLDREDWQGVKALE